MKNSETHLKQQARKFHIWAGIRHIPPLLDVVEMLREKDISDTRVRAAAGHEARPRSIMLQDSDGSSAILQLAVLLLPFGFHTSPADVR